MNNIIQLSTKDMNTIKLFTILRIVLVPVILMLIPLFVSAQEYKLVWSDEFTDGMSKDWSYDIGGSGWGNNELQYYTNSNTSVSDGILKITVKKENRGTNKYTSSRIKTKGAKAWKYGRIEARIKLAKVQGNFPAFWMLGASFNGSNWPYCGEIDIMEQINKDDILHANVHYDDNGHRSNNKSINCKVSEFHVYAIDWDENSIRFLLDGDEYHKVNIANGIDGTDEYHKEHFILLNYAMGGDWPGFVVDESALPASMEVDYVRVYQKDQSTGSSNERKKKE
ncbi:MAG: family 16 glycosylhydrolase [Prolixibacteraceae bacterium]